MNDAGIDAGTTTTSDAGVLEVHVAEFGEVLRGDSADQAVTFKNSRATSVDLSLSIVGASFSIIGPTTLRLTSGQEASVQVRFSPAGLGRQEGTFSYGEGELPLIGTGIGPALELTPATIDLGTVPLYDGVPATTTTMLTARNVGLKSALQLFFDVQPADELCVGDCMGGAVSVDAGVSSEIPVRLTSITTGMKSWDVRVLSNDPANPMQIVPVRAEVVARPTCLFSVPARLSFGVMSAPETRELEVILENVGTENCEIASVMVSDPLFSLVNAGAGPQTIAPGEVLRVLVRAAPQGAVPSMPLNVAAELRFAINHPDGFARVPIDLELGPTCLYVAPSPVDFGSVQSGCRSADRTITIRNVCTRTIGITSASLPGFSSFSVSAALPAQLAPNYPLTLTARFTPFAVGPARDVIDVTWTDLGATKHTTVPLVGEANTTGENIERFPAGTTKLDLILAIDDSGSMMDKAATISSQLPRLLTALLANNVDFRIAVLPASSFSYGRFRKTTSGLRWLTPSTPSLATQFSELTAYTGTFEDEGCEYAVLNALTPPNATDPMLNGGFLRPDSMLSVMCITDLTDTNQLLRDLLQAKGAGRRFVWDDIGPDGPGTMQCFVNPISHSGPTHREMTGGQLLDICATDWSPFLDKVAARATGTREFFSLNGRPDPLGTPPMSVSVTGQNVPAATDGGTAVWSWESAPNAVVFSPLYAPLPTEPVTISYPVACMP